MRARLLSLVALLLATGCTRSAPPAAPPSGDAERAPVQAEIPADLRASVERSIGLGREIYLQDKAGWIGTDVLHAAVKSLDGKGMGGFLAIREGDESGPLPSYLVLFYTNESAPRIRYQVRVPFEHGKRPSLETFDPPREVPEDMALLIRARQAAIEAAGPFKHRVNPVVLPDPDGGILVYLLMPATRPKTVVLGKHYRVSLTIKGVVKTVEPLSKGYLELSTAPQPGDQPSAIFVTNLVSAYPLETHVAASLMADLPILVSTDRGIWYVKDDSIAYFPEKAPPQLEEKAHFDPRSGGTRRGPGGDPAEKHDRSR